MRWTLAGGIDGQQGGVSVDAAEVSDEQVCPGQPGNDHGAQSVVRATGVVSFHGSVRWKDQSAVEPVPPGGQGGCVGGDTTSRAGGAGQRPVGQEQPVGHGTVGAVRRGQRWARGFPGLHDHPAAQLGEDVSANRLGVCQPGDPAR